MHWTDKRRAQARVGHELRQRGWTLYGYTEDRSNLQTDYYAPASWHGIATHEAYPGLVLGVNTSGAHRDDWPTCRATPKGKTWHLEREGEILATGTGLSRCAGTGSDWQAGVRRYCDAIESAAIESAARNSTTSRQDVTIEQRSDGTWIFFPTKPDQSVRQRLKALGFWWKRQQQGWHNRNGVSDERLDWLKAESPLALACRLWDQHRPQDGDQAQRMVHDYVPDWLAAHMPALYDHEGERDPVVWLKLFLPEGRWTFYATAYSAVAPDGTPEILFGYIASPLGPDCDELCYLTLAEVRSLRTGLDLPVERDLWWTPRPLSEVKAALYGHAGEEDDECPPVAEKAAAPDVISTRLIPPHTLVRTGRFQAGIPMQHIALRSEARPEATVTTWEEAAEYLIAVWNARFARDPDPGWYHKTWFTITYRDGETYEGRIDVGDSATEIDIGAHMATWYDYTVGLRKPDHLSQEEYDQSVAARRKEGTVEQFEAFFEAYEIVEFDIVPLQNTPGDDGPADTEPPAKDTHLSLQMDDDGQTISFQDDRYRISARYVLRGETRYSPGWQVYERQGDEWTRIEAETPTDAETFKASLTLSHAVERLATRAGHPIRIEKPDDLPDHYAYISADALRHAQNADAAPKAPPAALPERWTADDLHCLLDELARGPILVSGAGDWLEIPTIHDIRGARHLGCGVFEAQTKDCTLVFDAGQAMRRTPSGHGYTRVDVRTGAFPYDVEDIRAKLETWLQVAEAQAASSTVEPTAAQITGSTVEPVETETDPQPETGQETDTATGDVVQARGAPAGALTIVYLDNGTPLWTGDVRSFAEHGEHQFHAAWQWLQERKTRNTRLLSKSYHGDRHVETRHKLSHIDALRRAVQGCYAEPDLPEDWDNPGLHLAAHIRALLRQAYLDVQDRDGRVFDRHLAAAFAERAHDDPLLGPLELTLAHLWSPERWLQSLDREVLHRTTWQYLPPGERRLAQKLHGDAEALLQALPDAAEKRRNAILSALADLDRVPDGYISADEAGRPPDKEPTPEPAPHNPYLGQTARQLNRALKRVDKAIKTQGGAMDFAYELAINDRGARLKQAQREMDALLDRRQQIVAALTAQQTPQEEPAPEPFSTTLAAWLDDEHHETQRSGGDMHYIRPDGERVLWPGTTSRCEVIVRQHRCEVERAIVERHPITEDVLHDYPDLAAQADDKGLTRPPIDDDYRPVWMRTQQAFSVSHPMSAAGVPIGKVDRTKERYHEIVVTQALEHGYPVPERVLNSYPWLTEAQEKLHDDTQAASFDEQPEPESEPQAIEKDETPAQPAVPSNADPAPSYTEEDRQIFDAQWWLWLTANPRTAGRKIKTISRPGVLYAALDCEDISAEETRTAIRRRIRQLEKAA